AENVDIVEYRHKQVESVAADNWNKNFRGNNPVLGNQRAQGSVIDQPVDRQIHNPQGTSLGNIGKPGTVVQTLLGKVKNPQRPERRIRCEQTLYSVTPLVNEVLGLIQQESVPETRQPHELLRIRNKPVQ